MNWDQQLTLGLLGGLYQLLSKCLVGLNSPHQAFILLIHLTEVFSARKHFSKHRAVKVSELKW